MNQRMEKQLYVEFGVKDCHCPAVAVARKVCLAIEIVSFAIVLVLSYGIV